MLLDEYHKKKKARQAKTVAAADTQRLGTPNADEGRFRVTLNDCTVETALGDSGSDFSAISLETFNQVKKSSPDLHTEKLEEPLTLHGAFKADMASASSSFKVKLMLTISLPGSNIPIRFRNVYFLVVNDDMDEILLGRPFLKSIGFNLVDHLTRFRDSIDGKSLEHVDAAGMKTASTSNSGMTYMAPDDDPIKLPECIAANIGNDSKESIDKAFNKMVAEAEGNGISPEGLERIKSLLVRFRGIFRIKLGNDPPASVPPLKITMTPNAKPVCSMQRRYAPKQKEFMIKTIKELEAVGAIYKNPSAR